MVCLARIMVYFGFYNFSKLLCLARVLFDGLDVKSAAVTGPSPGLFSFMGKTTPIKGHEYVRMYKPLQCCPQPSQSGCVSLKLSSTLSV